MINANTKIKKISDIEQKTITQKYFKLWYEEYKDFVNVKDLPDIKIEPFIDTESPRCYIDPKKYKIVHANQLNYYVLGEKSTKSIAFHEFTHVYDHYLLKKNSIVDKENYALIYHEYHATILEMMCALQFRNITENPEINIYTSKVYLEREHKNLKQYLLDEKKNKIELFETLLKEPLTITSWVEVARFIAYTLGRIEFLRTYCRDALEVFDIQNYLQENLGVQL
ncbi:hypothetical protein [Ruminococcus sp. AF20-12LB]|uniref:hypothetical protein n=1 Tax=Ruminococcus sp. AF20-12LB TaxID=2293160 RepID=UPI000E4E97EB|nr:hypothetical protein [Ruminococcus sp. AF20-12LB]RHR04726.1 hypothetical protein DWX61_12145 [Ruminococcus sp. AF20-12LB]